MIDDATMRELRTAADMAGLSYEFAALVAERDAAVLELALRRKSGSASDRLHNLCEGISKDADGSEWSREEWEKLDADMQQERP